MDMFSLVCVYDRMEIADNYSVVLSDGTRTNVIDLMWCAEDCVGDKSAWELTRASHFAFAYPGISEGT